MYNQQLYAVKIKFAVASALPSMIPTMKICSKSVLTTSPSNTKLGVNGNWTMEIEAAKVGIKREIEMELKNIAELRKSLKL